MAHLPAPRRSLHFVPAGNDRFCAKALESAADVLVFDLEDSIPPSEKDVARSALAGWLQEVETDKEILVRINRLATSWGADDVAVVAGSGRADLLVPKVQSIAELSRIDEMLTGTDVEIVALTPESPEAVFELPRLAVGPRVIGLCWGAEDLATELGASSVRVDGALLPVFETVRSHMLLASAASRVSAFDAVYPDVGDHRGLRAEATTAAAMGFDGKLTIHPDQIDIVNQAFTPAPDDVARARELVAAFDDATASGRGAMSFHGEMVDATHLDRARRVLARAEPAR